jgi:hypothetical protein
MRAMLSRNTKRIDGMYTSEVRRRGGAGGVGLGGRVCMVCVQRVCLGYPFPPAVYTTFLAVVPLRD